MRRLLVCLAVQAMPSLQDTELRSASFKWAWVETVTAHCKMLVDVAVAGLMSLMSLQKKAAHA